MSALMKAEPTLFDYAVVPETDRTWLQEQEEAIRHFHRRAVMDLLTIGNVLGEVQARIQRGHFKKWLRCRAGYSQRTAYRYIEMARRFSPFKDAIESQQDNIDVCALHKLSEASVSPAALVEAVACIKAKMPLTRAKAAELIAKHKPARTTPQLFRESDEPPPPESAPGDSRFIATLHDLAKNNGPVTLDAVTDADDPDDALYTVKVIGLPLASGRTFPEAVDVLTGRMETQLCKACFDALVRQDVPIDEAKARATYPIRNFTAKAGHKATGRASECRDCSRKRTEEWKEDQRAA